MPDAVKHEAPRQPSSAERGSGTTIEIEIWGCCLNLRPGTLNRGVWEVQSLRFEWVLSPDGWSDVEGLLELFSLERQLPRPYALLRISLFRNLHHEVFSAFIRKQPM